MVHKDKSILTFKETAIWNNGRETPIALVESITGATYIADGYKLTLLTPKISKQITTSQKAEKEVYLNLIKRHNNRFGDRMSIILS